jgi:hypothetical protein
LILVILAGGYFILSGETKKAASQNLAGETALQTTKQSVANETNNVQEEKSSNARATVVHQKAAKKGKTTKPLSNSVKHIVSKSVPVSVPSKEKEKAIAKTPPPVIDDNEGSAVNETVASTPTTQAAKKEKKKLREVIKNIFNKPREKKEEAKTETVLEDPKPATNRQSTKREEDAANTGSSAGSGVALAEQIDISSNAPDNWMMGVKGLKLTLRNRSNTTIQSAAVDVMYYDENNRMLDKKTIYFNNVSPKGKLTVAAPDDKWADHVAFKLGAVSAKDDRYARNDR